MTGLIGRGSCVGRCAAAVVVGAERCTLVDKTCTSVGTRQMCIRTPKTHT